MPIYEYVCQACGKPAEILQKISDPPETDCPACHRPALQKQVSAAGFRLTGAGWYETDFKSGNKKNLLNDKPDSGTTVPSADTPAAAAAPKTDSSPAPAATPAPSTPSAPASGS